MLMDSSEDDDDETVGPEGPNDENEDPGVLLLHSTATLPNILPVPAFIFAAIMGAYSTDAATLCLATIAAIKNRATLAGEDPVDSPTARKAAYVATWLWNVASASTRALRHNSAGVVTRPAMNPRADIWSRDTHLRHLATRAAVSTTSTTADALIGAPTHEAWTNLANALALQVTERANSSTVTTKKTGFDAFR